MAWYIARSLDKLLAQLNTLAPNRSKVSDGGIGDPAHSARTSDHNPITGTGQVCARDFTHDPAGGLDCGSLAARLTSFGDSRIKYVIWDRRIWTPGVGWRNYTGTNPHTHHLHLSVKAGSVGDNQAPWYLGVSDEGNEVELSDTVKLWDGDTVTVAQLLVGLFGRTADLYDNLVTPQNSLVSGSTYKAPTQTYVRQVDARTYAMAKDTERIDDIEAKVDGLIAGLNGLVLKVNELLERTEPNAE